MKGGFPDCGDIIEREVKRIELELKIYSNVADKVKTSGLDNELQDYMMMVLKEMYMKTDPRFKHLDRMKALQQFMRHEKFGISEDDISRARDVDIWTLHEFRNKKGNSAICPFHSDMTPSFAIRKNRYICFGCGVKGDAIDFIMRLENLKFQQAVKYLLDKK